MTPTLTSQGLPALRSSNLIATTIAALGVAVVVGGGYLSRGDIRIAAAGFAVTFAVLGGCAFAGHYAARVATAGPKGTAAASYAVPTVLVGAFPFLLGGRPGLVSLVCGLVYLGVCFILGRLLSALKRTTEISQ